MCMDELALYVIASLLYYYGMSTDAASQQDVNVPDHPSLLEQGKVSHGNHVTSNHVCYHYQMYKCGSLSTL